MLVGACCLLCVAHCVLFVVKCALFVACCSSFVGCCLFVVSGILWLLCVLSLIVGGCCVPVVCSLRVRCVLDGVCCLSFFVDVCRSLSDCYLFVVRCCLLFLGFRLLFVGCW